MNEQSLNGNRGRGRKGTHPGADEKVNPEWEGLLRVPDVGRFMNMSVPAVYSAVARNQIPVIRWGRRLRFRRSDLDALLAEHDQRPTETPVLKGM